MDLTDSVTIAVLVSSNPVAGSKISRNSSRADYTRINRRGTCQCGSCRTCLDNAKWERVFSERFEDPDYYKPRPTWGGSSLASF